MTSTPSEGRQTPAENLMHHDTSFTQDQLSQFEEHEGPILEKLAVGAILHNILTAANYDSARIVDSARCDLHPSQAGPNVYIFRSNAIAYTHAPTASRPRRNAFSLQVKSQGQNANAF
jgi:hypothetical protein